MKRILILGGGGFIGTNISETLLADNNNEVTIADNFIRGDERIQLLKNKFSDDRLKIINIDLTNPSEFTKLNSSYHFVYMLAAMVGVDKVNAVPDEVIKVNSLLVINVLEWLKKSDCSRVVFTSTSETYAGTIDAFGGVIPTPESIPLCIEDISHPRFTYAITKMLGESGFINYASKGYFDAIIVRYHNVYGPMMGFRHVIPHLAERFIKQENPFLIYGHDQTRSFNYIDDAVLGTILAAEKGVSGEIYHIGDSQEISIEVLTKYVGNLFEYDGKFEYADTFPGSVSRRCPDISKAIQHLGYKPATNWELGVKKTIEWYKSYIHDNSDINESFYDQYGIKK